MMETLFANELESTQYRSDGLIPSTTPPSQQQLYRAFHDDTIYSAAPVLPQVDLRSDMPPVEDQSQLGTW